MEMEHDSHVIELLAQRIDASTLPDTPRHVVERRVWSAVNREQYRSPAEHRGHYAHAYAPDRTGVLAGDHYRTQSAGSTFSRMGDPAHTLPIYGADRDALSERVRRYDLDDRTSRDLERAADDFLRSHGFGSEVLATDVVDRWTLLPEVTPDRVAYRGAAHFKPRAVHSSERRIGRRTEQTMIDTGTPGTELLVTLAATHIKRTADGVTVLYRGCVGRGYYGRKVIVAPRVKGTGSGRRKSAVWSLKPASVRQRWAVMIAGGTPKRPVAPDVVAGLLAAERDALATLTRDGRTIVHGATLDAAHDRSVNGRSRVIVRATDDAPATMTDDTGIAVRRALLASIQ